VPRLPQRLGDHYDALIANHVAFNIEQLKRFIFCQSLSYTFCTGRHQLIELKLQLLDRF
jgi:hypothetical protein